MALQPINVTYDFRSGAVISKTAVEGNEIPNKAQIESMIQGNIAAKESVKVATHGNVDLATGGLLTFDSYTLLDGDRVLVAEQTNLAENGIYIASAGAWSRAADADEQSELKPYTYVFVLKGDHAGRKFQLINDTAPVVGTDDQLWSVVPVPANEAANTTLDSSLLSLYSDTNLQDAMATTNSLIDSLNTQTGTNSGRLTSLVGSNTGDLGAFTGTTIPDSSDVKTALQSIEASLEQVANDYNTSRFISATDIGVPNALWTVVTHNLNTQFPSSVQLFDAQDNYTHVTHGFRWRPKAGSTTEIEIYQDSGANRAVKIVAHR